MTDQSDSPSLADEGTGEPDDDRARGHADAPAGGPAQGSDLEPPPALDTAPEVALFLDFDGTLVDIADHPDDVEVAQYLPGLIEALADRLGGRLALVSGRSLAALEELLGPVRVAMAGSHGGEFRPAGSREVHPLADPLPEAVVYELSTFAHDNGGLHVEPKPFSIAVHYRRHPEALEGLLACAEAVAGEYGLKIKHGKQVIELAMPGSDKGSAVEKFMTLPPFAGGTPVFAGDDVTDEDAFRAVAPLGGVGILVGPMRETAASWRLADVRAVHDWLAAALNAPAAPTDTQGDTPA